MRVVNGRLRPRLPPGDRQLVRRPGRRLGAFHHDQARLDPLDDPGRRVLVHLAIERDDDRAELPEGEQVDRRLPATGQPGDDAITMLDTESAELVGKPIDEPEQLLAVDGLPEEPLLAAEGDRRGLRCGALANDLVQVTEHPHPLTRAT